MRPSELVCYRSVPTLTHFTWSELYMLHAAPGRMRSAETHAFRMIISNLSNKPRWSPKHMVLAHEKAPNLFILTVKANKSPLHNNLERTEKIVAAVHYEQKAKRKDWMQRPETGHSLDSHQVKQERKEKVDMSEYYSEYRQKFIQWWNHSS